MNALMAFLDTPLGFLVGSLVIIGTGVTIYILALDTAHGCGCPRRTLRTQDGSGFVEKTHHLPTCEAQND